MYPQLQILHNFPQKKKKLRYCIENSAPHFPNPSSINKLSLLVLIHGFVVSSTTVVHFTSSTTINNSTTSNLKSPSFHNMTWEKTVIFHIQQYLSTCILLFLGSFRGGREGGNYNFLEGINYLQLNENWIINHKNAMAGPVSNLPKFYEK